VREGLLKPGRAFTTSWSRRGETFASIDVTAGQGFVTLKYRHRLRGDTDWQDKQYPVYLSSTPCNLGGERQWFICPANGCGRRVAILYGGGVYACRNCYRLAYPSQREAFHDRAIRRADKIRDKLDWEPGTGNGHGQKPKGMHRRTFERLCAEHDDHSQTGWSAFMARYRNYL
jgi:hypothetical protein